MKSALARVLFALVLFPLAAHAAEQDPQAAINAKLREGLRNTMIQLRDSQAKVAELQAVKVGDDAKIKDLETKLADLAKKSSDERLAAEKAIADQKELLAKQDERNARQLAALARWKDAYNKLVDQAKAIDAKRAAAVNDKIQLTRQLEDAQRKNLALYDLGKEILHRYEHYGLGDAITAKEPFSGIAKTKLQNYVQDKGDALLDQKVSQ